VLPLIVPGPPGITLKATVSPDVADATSVIGDTPYVTGDAGWGKVIVCDAGLIVNVTVVVTVL